VIVSIMQPAYLPWLGYFDRIARSDLHIVLDQVQADLSSKTKFANRNKVRTATGWTWLTVPLNTKGLHHEKYLHTLEIVGESDWASRHWATMRLNYARAPYFSEHKAFFESVYARPWRRLSELNRVTNLYLLDALGIRRKILYGSEMTVTGKKDELILNLCKAVEATTYISGPFGRDYLHESEFHDVGIEVRYHEYRHPTYPQTYSGFEPYMSVVDLLFNCGPDSLRILTNSRAPDTP